ncbi:MAG: Ig-like domain-containing protein [Prolixibacteraceae bacterium]
MKLCGCVHWFRIGWLVVLLNLLFLPNFTYSQNLPPVLDIGVSNQHAEVGSVFSYTIPSNAFKDENGDALTYSVRDLPAGLLFNPSTNLISGKPTGAGSLVKVDVDDGKTVSSTSFTIYVHAANDTYAAFTMNTDKDWCNYQQIRFTNLSKGATKYEWSFGNGNTSKDAEPTAVYSSPGTYKVELIINPGVNQKTAVEYITIYPLPKPKISEIINNGCEPHNLTLNSIGSPVFVKDTILSGQTVQSVSGGAEVYYYWYFFDKHEALYTYSASAAVTNLSSGKYDVLLEVTDVNGCQGASSLYELFEVYRKPEAAFAFNKLCEPSLTTFTAKDDPAGEKISKYFWQVNGTALTSTSNPANYNFANLGYGEYEVSLQTLSDKGCSSDVNTDTVKFNLVNTVNFAVQSGSCANDTVVVLAQTSGNAVSYKWIADNNGIVIGTSPTLKHLFNTPALHNLDLTVTFNDGCSKTASKSVGIDRLTADFTFDASYNCVSNFDVKLESAPSNSFLHQSISKYTWYDVTDSSPKLLSTQNLFTAKFDDTGIYDVKLEIESDQGCKASISKKITLELPQISINVSGTTSGCLPAAPSIFNAIFSSGSETAVSYTWDFGDGSAAGIGNNIQYTYVNPGEYNVSVTVLSSNGCPYTRTLNKAVMVANQPTVITVIQNQADNCYNTGVLLDVTSTPGTDFLIFETGTEKIQVGITATPQRFKYTPPDVGNYNFKVTANDNGCLSIPKLLNGVVVNGPKASFIPSQTTFCDDNNYTVNFINNSSHSPLGTDYQWDINGATFSTNENFSHDFSTAQNYAVSLKVTDGVCSDTKRDTVSIFSVDTSKVVIAADIFAGCAPLSVQFSTPSLSTVISNNIKIRSYGWDFNNDNVIDTTTTTPSIKHIYKTPGIQTVKLTIRSEEGCNYDFIEPSMITVYGTFVDFSIPNTPNCQGTAIPFTSSVSSPTGIVTNADLYNYSWKFGDGSSSAQKHPTQTYGSQGKFDVTLKVLDDHNCTTSLLKKDFIDIDQFTINFSLSDTLICNNEAIEFQPNPTGNIVEYQWDFDGNGIVDRKENASNAVSYTYTLPGTYKVSVRALNAQGCSQTFSKNIKVINVTANFTVRDQNIGCAPAFAFFTPDALPNEVVSYHWNFGDGKKSNERSPRNFYVEPGTYSVSLQVEFIGGCSKTVSKSNLIVADGAVGSFDYDNTPGCAPKEVLFNVGSLSSNVNKITWDFGKGYVKAENIAIGTPAHSINYTYDSLGWVTPRVILTDAVCGDYAYSNLSRGSIYTSIPPKIDFSVDMDTICKGVSIQFTDNSTSPDLKYKVKSWEWNFGASPGDTTSQQNPKFAYSTKGSYSPELVVFNELGCSDTLTKTNGIYIYSNDALSADFDLSDALVCPNQLIDITSKATAGTQKMASFEWDFGAGFITGDSLTNTTYNDTFRGKTVSITHRVTDEGFCIASATRTVAINNLKADFEYDPQPVFRGSFVDFHEKGRTDFGTEIKHWYWTFQNANVSSSLQEDPSNIEYASIVDFDKNKVQLIVVNDNNCIDTLTKSFEVRNNPPNIDSFKISVFENLSYHFTALDFDNNNDPDNDHFNSGDDEIGQQIWYIKIRELSSHGKLYLNKTPIQVIDLNSTLFLDDLDDLIFKPDPGWYGTTYFTWNANDHYDFASTPKKVEIEVAKEPDPPILSDIVMVLPEDSIINLGSADFIKHMELDFQGNTFSFDSLYLRSAPQSGTVLFAGQSFSTPRYFTKADFSGPNGIFQIIPDHGSNETITFIWNAFDGYNFAEQDAIVSITYKNTTPKLSDIVYDDIKQGTTIALSKGLFNQNISDPDQYDTIQDFYIRNLPTANQGIITYNNVKITNPNFQVKFKDMVNIKFQPHPNFEGLVEFVWLVSDGTDVASANVSITYINTPPQIRDFSISSPEDELYTFKLPDFEKPGNNSPFTDEDAADKLEEIKILSLPTNGTLAFRNTPISANFIVPRSAINELTFQPNADWFGTDSLIYNASDGTDYAFASSKIYLEILPVNDAPRTMADSCTIIEDHTLLGFSVATNDYDVDTDSALLRYGFDPIQQGNAFLHGRVELNAAGLLNFFPETNYSTDLYFIYEVCDDQEACTKDTVFIHIVPTNDPPTVVDDTFTITEDETTSTFNCLENDFDIDVQDFSMVKLNNRLSSSIDFEFGTVNWDTDGKLNFTLNSKVDALRKGEEVSILFTYAIQDDSLAEDSGNITLIIQGINDLPVANADDFYTSEGFFSIASTTAPFTSLLANDTDIENDSIWVHQINGQFEKSITSDYGIFTWEANGSWKFFENDKACDSLRQGELVNILFNYTDRDSIDISLASNFSITIEGVNDAPVAGNDTLEINEDLLSVTISPGQPEALLFNDTDIDGDYFSVSQIDGDGTGTTIGEFGDLNWNKNGSYSYGLNIDLNKLSVNDTIYDHFNYTIIDEFGAMDSAQLAVIIIGLNDPPKAKDDTILIYEDQFVTFIDSAQGLLSNDTDIDLDYIIVAVNGFGTQTSQGRYGTLTWEKDGSYTYQSDSNLVNPFFYGQVAAERFLYKIQDPSGATSEAYLNIRILGQNDAPIALNDHEILFEDDPPLSKFLVNEGLLKNDSDIDIGDKIKLTKINSNISSPYDGTYGLLEWNSNGTYRYTIHPDVDSLAINETVIDSFLYTIEDLNDSIGLAYLTIEIKGLNDLPVSENDTIYLNEDLLEYQLPYSLLDNVYDPDRDPISMLSLGDSARSPIQSRFGELFWTSTGAFEYHRYQPENIIATLDTLAWNDQVVDSVKFTAGDNNGTESSSQLYLYIQGVNDLPVTTKDSISILETTTEFASNSSTQLLANDYDVDRRDSIVITKINNLSDSIIIGTYGSLNWKPDGNYIYINNSEITDVLSQDEMVFDTFTYTVADLQNAQTSELFEVKITGVNDAPQAIDDSISIFEDQRSISYTGDSTILSNDWDTDRLDNIKVFLQNGQSDTIYIGSYGQLDLFRNGNFTYTLNPNLDSLRKDQITLDAFNYRIIDNNNAVSSTFATITFNIIGQNDAPQATNDSIFVTEDFDSIYSNQPNVPNLLENDFDPDNDPLWIASVNDVETKILEGNYGTLSWDSSGNYLYTNIKTKTDPLAEDEIAFDRFKYVLTDLDDKDTATFVVQIIGINDPPVAVQDSFQTIEANPVSRANTDLDDILDNDYDVDGFVKNIKSINRTEKDTIQGNYGVLVWKKSGSFAYFPDSAKAIALRPQQINTEIFDYNIEDNIGASDSSKVLIEILGINNGPSAYNDTIWIPEDYISFKNINLVSTDTDPDKDILRVTQIENDQTGIFLGYYGKLTWEQYGSVLVNLNRNAVDQIGPNAIKTETYTYTIVDEGGLTSSAELILKIIGENDPIVATNDRDTLPEDGHVLVDVLANDVDPDNNYQGNLAKNPVQIVVSAHYGKAYINSSNGAISYFPDQNFYGTDSLQYQVCDDAGSCDQAWLILEVIPVNDPPVATNLILKTEMNSPVSFNLFKQVNDLDDGIDPTSLTFPSTHLSQTDSILTYTPEADFVGQDEFIYSLADYDGARAFVIVNVQIPDDGDGAQDDWVFTNENTAIAVEILKNDTLNGFIVNPLSADIKIFPLHGVASYDPYLQVINYQPTENYNGTDSLTYIVGSITGISDFATVHIAVEPINSPIEANDDAKTTLINQTLKIPILENDVDLDNGIDLSSVVILQQAMNGSIVYDSISGLASYSPNKDFKGADHFSYRVCDLDPLSPSCDSASVFLLVKTKFDNFNAKNDAIATQENTALDILYSFLIENDGDENTKDAIDFDSFTILSFPQHGSYEWDTITNNIVYTPSSNYFGPDWITYQLCDSTGSCDMAEINIWVEEVNTPPVSGDDYYILVENTTKRLYVLSNDFDYDGTLDLNTLELTGGSKNGSINIDKNTGTILYQPLINKGDEELTYSICDNNGLCSTGTIYISIDLGATIQYNQTTYEDTPDTIDLSSLLATFNFNDNIENYLEVVTPEIGTWEFINNSTQLVYTPDRDSIGSDYYNIILYFPGLDTADLHVNVSILSLNDAPVAVKDTLIWPNNASQITIHYSDLLWNDYDVDGDSIFLREEAIASGDSLHIVFNGDSTITIGADTIFWCDAWFSYQISDPSGETAIGMVLIMPQQEGIIANADTASVDENSSANNLDVLANDVFKDHQLCTIASIEITQAPQHGVAASNEQNSVLYQPTGTYYGPDSLYYTITDIWGQHSGAWLNIDVLQRNTPPVAVDDFILNDFGQVAIIRILDNDYDPDPDGQIDTIQTYLNIDRAPQFGSAWFHPDSAYVVYTPHAFTCGTDQFSYTIFDNEGGSDSATVVIGLPDEAPLLAVNDTVKTYPGISIEFNVLINDEGYFIPNITKFTQPQTGSVEQSGDSTFVFYPNPDFAGNDSMSYQLVSPCENEATGKVIFMVEELRVPEIITPNNDQKNDVLIIDGINFYPDAMLQIYNRYGHIVYQRKGYENDWGGYSNQGSFGGNKPLPSGTYYYKLMYNEGKNNQTGFIYIFR